MKIKTLLARGIALCLACLLLAACGTGPGQTGATSEPTPEDTQADGMAAAALKYYQFTLDGVFYEMRVPYQDLKADGWYCTELDELDYEVGGLTRLRDTFQLEKDGVEGYLTFEVVNDTRGALPIQQCSICSISAKAEYGYVPIELPGGIMLGTSLDDVREIIQRADEEGTNTKMFEEKEDDGNIVFSFTVPAGAIYVRVDPADGVISTSVIYTYTGTG